MSTVKKNKMEILYEKYDLEEEERGWGLHKLITLIAYKIRDFSKWEIVEDEKLADDR